MAKSKFSKISFIDGETPNSIEAVEALKKRYGHVPAEEADVLITLGGDGMMLQTLHRHIHKPLPIYGMNFGSIGFLMNEFRQEDLINRLNQAEENIIHPLKLTAFDKNGQSLKALAINEVSLFRQTHQAAKLEISIDGRVRMHELICDGVMVATPAGSTAYNFSAHGPILPVGAQLLALTPISPFRPRRWRGALLSNRAIVEISVLEAEKRPISAVADHTAFNDIIRVEIAEMPEISLRLLFDPGHALDERIITEQFYHA